jgi:pseudaminic acid cytidylyltransferase
MICNKEPHSSGMTLVNSNNNIKSGNTKRKRLAFVPARGGSKRVRNKNIKDFLGKPALARVLDTIQQAKICDEIHVSTNNLEIKDVATQCGCEPAFLRPDCLSDDYTSIGKVIDFVMAQYEKRGMRFDTIVMVFATAVLLRPESLVAAVSYFERLPNCSELLSVSKFPVPLEWGFRKQDNGKLAPSQPEKLLVRSQDIEPQYYDNGQFVIYDSASVRSSCVGQSLFGYELNEFTVDIDDDTDWHLAEQLFRAR